MEGGLSAKRYVKSNRLTLNFSEMLPYPTQSENESDIAPKRYVKALCQVYQTNIELFRDVTLPIQSEIGGDIAAKRNAKSNSPTV